MTASAMKGDRERAIEAGMNDYVSKPIRIQTLINNFMLKRSFLTRVCFRKRLYVHNSIVLDSQVRSKVHLSDCY